MIRKHCQKRRKCWLPAFSPFPTMFSKDFFNDFSLKVGVVWESVYRIKNGCEGDNLLESVQEYVAEKTLR